MLEKRSFPRQARTTLRKSSWATVGTQSEQSEQLWQRTLQEKARMHGRPRQLSFGGLALVSQCNLRVSCSSPSVSMFASSCSDFARLRVVITVCLPPCTSCGFGPHIPGGPSFFRLDLPARIISSQLSRLTAITPHECSR